MHMQRMRVVIYGNNNDDGYKALLDQRTQCIHAQFRFMVEDIVFLNVLSTLSYIMRFMLHGAGL